jgi:hypothetical protein
MKNKNNIIIFISTIVIAIAGILYLIYKKILDIKYKRIGDNILKDIDDYWNESKKELDREPIIDNEVANVTIEADVDICLSSSIRGSLLSDKPNIKYLLDKIKYYTPDKDDYIISTSISTELFNVTKLNGNTIPFENFRNNDLYLLNAIYIFRYEGKTYMRDIDTSPISNLPFKLLPKKLGDSSTVIFNVANNELCKDILYEDQKRFNIDLIINFKAVDYVDKSGESYSYNEEYDKLATHYNNMKLINAELYG